MGILRRTERSMVKVMCGAQFKDRKRSMDLMSVRRSKEAADQLSISNIVGMVMC